MEGRWMGKACSYRSLGGTERILLFMNKTERFEALQLCAKELMAELSNEEMMGFNTVNLTQSQAEEKCHHEQKVKISENTFWLVICGTGIVLLLIAMTKALSMVRHIKVYFVPKERVIERKNSIEVLDPKVWQEICRANVRRMKKAEIMQIKDIVEKAKATATSSTARFGLGCPLQQTLQYPYELPSKFASITVDDIVVTKPERDDNGDERGGADFYGCDSRGYGYDNTYCDRTSFGSSSGCKNLPLHHKNHQNLPLHYKNCQNLPIHYQNHHHHLHHHHKAYDDHYNHIGCVFQPETGLRKRGNQLVNTENPWPMPTFSGIKNFLKDKFEALRQSFYVTAKKQGHMRMVQKHGFL
ncbi:unnamed protein product [Bursaphelenchus okinawaensis]|uniref:Uncharacterized protein n=1 Tax=Bursaphelenchus okinawaensis TaxID=465554 RepID=A0A811L480_9BILA|nr:unnamed protein product [Bursaphelenchus okinawaensis]CAG9116988.1 unnamed protein product [Bursaphelenchus okinawaensis]